jgi:hypothetical protein
MKQHLIITLILLLSFQTFVDAKKDDKKVKNKEKDLKTSSIPAPPPNPRQNPRPRPVLVPKTNPTNGGNDRPANNKRPNLKNPTKTNEKIKDTKAPSLKPTKAPNKQEKRKCRICPYSYRVPNPRLILLDKKCSDWNRQEYSDGDCRSIQSTVGAACQCRDPPKPRCDICENGGDYIWNVGKVNLAFLELIFMFDCFE